MKQKGIMTTQNDGFTLLETLIVTTILAIILSIAVPLYKGHIERTKQIICNVNCAQLERMYHFHLITENRKHTNYVFEEFLLQYNVSVCPSNGDIKYQNGKVRCVLHSKDESNENEGDEEDRDVPFL